MEPRTNLKLLFLSLCLVISLNSARSGRLAPSLAPAPQPASSPSSTPAQAPDSSRSDDLDAVAPSSESVSVSQSTEADSDSDASSDGQKDDSNSITTLNIKKESKEDSDDSSSDAKKDESDSKKDESDSSSDAKKEESDAKDESDSKKDESDSSSEDKKDESDSSSEGKKDESDSSSDAKKEESDSSSDAKKNANIDFTADLHALEVSPELKKICDQTDHTALCIATVLPLVKDGAKAKVSDVLQVAVDATNTYAKEAMAEAKKLSAKPDTPENVKAILKDCEDGYDSAIDSFQKTLDAFATNDVGTMRSMLSAVITFVGDCQDQFTEMQIESPLTTYAEKLTEMTSNCLAISSLGAEN